MRIADGRWKLVGPKKVGGIDDFYRLVADDIDESKTPPLVIEVLLGELDKLASTRIDQLLAVEPGPITDDGLKFDMALVVGAQMMRGESFRREQLALLEFLQNNVSFTKELDATLPREIPGMHRGFGLEYGNMRYWGGGAQRCCLAIQATCAAASLRDSRVGD